MTTVVLGAGVIGVTTAYYLARDGHRVIVVDREPAAGLGTSYANGGLVTPSMADPWAAPGVPRMLLQGLGRDDAPFVLRLAALPALMGWGLRFLGNCSPARWRANTEAVFRLARFSRDALDRLTDKLALDYDRFAKGNLRIYRDGPSFDQAAKGAAVYRDIGVACELVDGAGTVSLEPALRPVQAAIRGAVHFPDDRSGDAHRFSQEMARHAAAAGVEFRWLTTILGLETDGDRVAAVRTDKGRIAGDRFVLALASYSPLLARGIGLRLPIRPVKGYSATFPIVGWNDAPVMPVIDYKLKAAITRLGDRIRLAGTAEFAGYDHRPNAKRSALLLRAFNELFPERRDPAGVSFWNGLRPMTPDGRPLLGPTRYKNLLLNTGHGPLGWTLACGSAAVTADLIAGRKSDVPVEDFALNRLRQ